MTQCVDNVVLPFHSSLFQSNYQKKQICIGKLIDEQLKLCACTLVCIKCVYVVYTTVNDKCRGREMHHSPKLIRSSWVNTAR